ncbi:EamA family transporter, partial [Nocardia sp. SYP-A9097]|uniref:EamA family transporter n=1 Tax=Nocardia sp. SYP-A9097 TaxID=2663237 RepID=UPI00129A2BD2
GQHNRLHATNIRHHLTTPAHQPRPGNIRGKAGQTSGYPTPKPVGMAAAAVLLAPLVLIPQLAIGAAVFADPRTWLLGLGVGVLSSAVPYALDQVVLTAVGRARFALLLALLPATATLVGAIALAQRPTVLELAGIALVMLALTISAIPARQPAPEPPAPL